METATADPLTDLNLEGAEARLAAIDAERDQRLRPLHAIRDDKATGPPSPPLSAAARWCSCTRPVVDDPDDATNCMKCGKSLPAAMAPPHPPR